MDCNDKNHWQLYTSKGYLWMNGKNILDKVNIAMSEIGAEVYDIKYMSNDGYLNYLRVKFDRILKMPSAVK